MERFSRSAIYSTSVLAMNFAVSAAALFLVCSQGWIATNAAQCPQHCAQEVGEGNKVFCDCCNKDPNFPPILSPCSSVFCANATCVNVECEECIDGISIKCRPNCGPEPSSCPAGQLLVRNDDKCNYCKVVGEEIMDPCALAGACLEGECALKDVPCDSAPCYPVNECRKICPPMQCPWGCYQYEKMDGCNACKCCRYEL